MALRRYSTGWSIDTGGSAGCDHLGAGIVSINTTGSEHVDFGTSWSTLKMAVLDVGVNRAGNVECA